MQILWKRAALLGAVCVPLVAGVALACPCQNRERPQTGEEAAPAPPKTEEKPAVQLGPNDKGKSFALKEGQILEVALPSNPTTGFQWNLGQTDAAILAPHGASTFDAPSSDAQGAATIQRLRFRALKSGATSLELVYKRPWESDDKIAQRWNASLVVSAP